MTELIIGVIVLIIGIGIGIYIGLHLRKDDLNTDECLKHLRAKGYWVKLNVSPDKR